MSLLPLAAIEENVRRAQIRGATSVESYLMIAGKTEVAALGLVNRIDGYYAEEHRARVRTTEYPVETGADLTDHVVREPYRLKLKGSATEFQQGNQAGLNAWAAVLGHINARRPIAVVTRLGTYLNMVMVDAKPIVNESTGLSLDIDIELKEILRANVTRGTAPSGGVPLFGPALDRAEPPRARGRTQFVPYGPDVATSNLNRVSSVPVPGRATPIPTAQPMPVPRPP